MGNLQAEAPDSITAQLQIVCQKLPALRIIFITTIYQQKYPPAVECLEFPSEFRGAGLMTLLSASDPIF